MRIVKIRSDYDRDTILTIVRNDDGDVAFRVSGRGEMRLTNHGGHLHGAAWGKFIDAIESIIDIYEGDEQGRELPLTKAELVELEGKPVWAIELAPNVDTDVPRHSGWGIVPTKDSFRQVLTQDFDLSAYWMSKYGINWIAFPRDMHIDRWHNETNPFVVADKEEQTNA